MILQVILRLDGYVPVRRDVVDGVVLSVGRAGVEVLDSPGRVDSATEVVDSAGGGPGDLG